MPMVIKCPDRIVKFEHRKYLVEYNDSNHIKLCYKLTKDHVLYPHIFKNVMLKWVWF